MTDPKPLTPEEFDECKDYVLHDENLGHDDAHRLIATIEAAWAEVAALHAREVEYLDTTHRLEQERDKALADLAQAERTMGICSGPCHGERGQEYMDALDKALADVARMREGAKSIKHLCPDLDQPGPNQCPLCEALSSSPDDWLRRHDAEVRSGAFEEAAKMVDDGLSGKNKSTESIFARLRERAAEENLKRKTL